MNSYTNITKNYDLLMLNGYYNYDEITSALISQIGDRKKILELGIGTGIVVERLLKLVPRLEITGIDYTESMLEAARKKIENKCKLIYTDVGNMQLKEDFDAIFSVGGVWYFIDNGNEYTFCSHIPDIDDNYKAMENVSKHLKKEGLLLFSIQGPHTNYEKVLPGGIIYSQKIYTDGECFNKEYVFKTDGETLKQICRYRLFNPVQTRALMEKAGFDFVNIEQKKNFFLCRKKSS